ncbi:MAG: two pore domain potassium channel family protein [Planctomycetota bacterium]|nr:MAG: two pore domain potassium channel family protein [Planctomycetota bacterium]
MSRSCYRSQMRGLPIPTDPWKWLKNRTLPLLFVLVALLAFHPFFVDGEGRPTTAFPALFAFVPLLGLFALTSWKRAVPLVALFAGAVVWAGVGYGFDINAIAKSPLEIMLFVYYMYAALLLGVTLLRSSAELDDRVYGGFVVYLLVAVGFSTLHRHISAVDPSAYWSTVHAHSELLEWDEALYFSMVTITTLGFGDIVPTNAWARAITTLEAASGLFITAVVIARLASPPSSEPPRPRASDDHKHA